MEKIITKHSETELAITSTPEPVVYSADYIIQRADDYRQSIANLQAEAQEWFYLEGKVSELHIKREEELNV